MMGSIAARALHFLVLSFRSYLLLWMLTDSIIVLSRDRLGDDTSTGRIWGWKTSQMFWLFRRCRDYQCKNFREYGYNSVCYDDLDKQSNVPPQTHGRQRDNLSFCWLLDIYKQLLNFCHVLNCFLEKKMGSYFDFWYSELRKIVILQIKKNG